VKDIAPRGLNLDEDGWCDIGTGIVKWPAVFCALGQSRCMHFILEHDNPADVGRFIRRSAAACRKM
jgi:sugar phosphate isomerase/epimerase